MVPDNASCDISFSYHVCNVTCKFPVLVTCIYMTWSERAETDDWEIISPNQYHVIRTYLFISMLFLSRSVVITVIFSYVELHALPTSLLPSMHTPDKSSLGRLRKYRSAAGIFYSQNKLKLLTYSMEQSPSWEANQFAAGQEIPHILWNPKVHYCIHKCPPPPCPEPVRFSPYPPHPTFLNILHNIILPSMPGCPQWSLSFRFPHQNPVHASPLPFTCYMPCPSHSINRNYSLKTVLTTWSS